MLAVYLSKIQILMESMFCIMLRRSTFSRGAKKQTFEASGGSRARGGGRGQEQVVVSVFGENLVLLDSSKLTAQVVKVVGGGESLGMTYLPQFEVSNCTSSVPETMQSLMRLSSEAEHMSFE